MLHIDIQFYPFEANKLKNMTFISKTNRIPGSSKANKGYICRLLVAVTIVFFFITFVQKPYGVSAISPLILSFPRSDIKKTNDVSNPY